MLTLREGLFACDELAARYREALLIAQRGDLRAAEHALFSLLGEPLSEDAAALIANDLGVLTFLLGDGPQADDWFRRASEWDAKSDLPRRNQQALALPKLRPTVVTNASSLAASSGQGPQPTDRKRIAIVSLLFNWPSKGGGNVHTVGLGQALLQAGHFVRHFYVRYEPWRVGTVDEPLPFPTEVLEFNEDTWSLAAVCQAVRASLIAYVPDVVIVTDSWNAKPWLAEAAAVFPYLLRFDALECVCPLNNLRLLPTPDKNVRSCPRSQLATSSECASCVTKLGVLSGFLHQAEREFARVGSPDYLKRLHECLQNAIAVLVHNPLIEALVEPFASKTCVVPIGVDPVRFQPRRGDDHDPVRFLFAGRVGDVVKGFPVLAAAGASLWQRRHDFRIVATGHPTGAPMPFVEWIGWRPYAELPSVLNSVDALVAPALAQEPLGLSAIEGMAAGIPVLASEVGGLQYTVIDGLTGWLCSPGDVGEVARRMEQAIEDPALRRRMGSAGRSRFEQYYAWPAVVEQHYEPLFREASRAARTS